MSDYKPSSATGFRHILNTALVFINPNSFSLEIKALVEETLIENDIRIVMDGLKAPQSIKENNIINRLYANISRYTYVSGNELKCMLPDSGKEKFEQQFGVSFNAVCDAGKVLSASEAMEKLRYKPIGPSALNTLWYICEKKIKIDAGLEIGYSSDDDKYLINGFYPLLLENFTCDENRGVQWYVVSWCESNLSWGDFRSKVIGSIRENIRANWITLGLSERPSAYYDCIHASDGPLSATAERLIWIGGKFAQDSLVRLCRDLGISSQYSLAKLIHNPVMKLTLPNGATEGPACVFDLLCDAKTSTFIEILRILEKEELSKRSVNHSLIFLKPHVSHCSNVEALLRDILGDAQIYIDDEGIITGNEIEEKGLIDKHYSVISKYAMSTMRDEEDDEVGDWWVAPTAITKLPPPPRKAIVAFHKQFGVSWATAVESGRVLTAAETMDELDLSPLQLQKKWNKSNEKLRLAPGVYVCSFVDDNIYVINGFYPFMREKYTDPGSCIRWYAVSWAEDNLSWADFRTLVVGSTDPSKAVDGSLRSMIYKKWELLGLDCMPTVIDNGVHASAGPLEALAERRICLNIAVRDDPFAKTLISKHGITEEFLTYCCTNPLLEVDMTHVSRSFNPADGTIAEGISDKLLQTNKYNNEEITSKYSPNKPTETGYHRNPDTLKRGFLFNLLEETQSSYAEIILRHAFEFSVQQQCSTNSSHGINTAVVFIKPLAVTHKVRHLLMSAFTENNIEVVASGSKSAQDIVEGNLIDLHSGRYSKYALQWKNDKERKKLALICQYEAEHIGESNQLLQEVMHCNEGRGIENHVKEHNRQMLCFLEKFGETLERAIKRGRIMSAKSAMEYIAQHTCTEMNGKVLDSEEDLAKRWKDAKNEMVLLPGVIVKEIVLLRTNNRVRGNDNGPKHIVNDSDSILVLNGFYPKLRRTYISEGHTPRSPKVEWFVVRWKEAEMSWAHFRNGFLGSTDPSDAPIGSVRRRIYNTWRELGITEKPDKINNGVHGSACPMEGIVDRMIWASESQISKGESREVKIKDCEEPSIVNQIRDINDVDAIVSLLLNDSVVQMLMEHNIDSRTIAFLCRNPIVSISPKTPFKPFFSHTERIDSSQLSDYIKQYQKEKQRLHDLSIMTDRDKKVEDGQIQFHKKEEDEQQFNNPTNRAFVFIKPHALLLAVKEYITALFQTHHIKIVAEGSIRSNGAYSAQIGHIVDKHYSNVSRYAIDIKPTEIETTEEIKTNFAAFSEGMDWDQSVVITRVLNAADAMLSFGQINAKELADKWDAIPFNQKTKLTEGLYIAYCQEEDTFFINGFYPYMREAYTAERSGIDYFVVEWPEENLSWKDFMTKVIGHSDPSLASDDTARGYIYHNWSALGLTGPLNNTNNGVHASMGPLYSLLDQQVWLSKPLEFDHFAVECCQKRGVSREYLQKWINNEEITLKSKNINEKAFGILELMQTSEAANIIADAYKQQLDHSNGEIVHISTRRKLYNACLQDRFLNINSMSTEEDLRSLFKYYDREKKGVIDRDEFRADYRAYEQYGQPMQSFRENDLFSKYDYNKDGKMTYDEFVIMMLERAAHL